MILFFKFFALQKRTLEIFLWRRKPTSVSNHRKDKVFVILRKILKHIYDTDVLNNILKYLLCILKLWFYTINPTEIISLSFLYDTSLGITSPTLNAVLGINFLLFKRKRNHISFHYFFYYYLFTITKYVLCIDRSILSSIKILHFMIHLYLKIFFIYAGT